LTAILAPIEHGGANQRRITVMKKGATSNRPRIRVEGLPGYAVVPGPTGSTGGLDPTKTYLRIVVANRRRRAVTISSVAIKLKKPGTAPPFLQATDSICLPKEIGEGKATDYLVQEEGLDLSNIKCLIAYDQTGRRWRGNVLLRK
jgi:hypothetical protein